MSLDHALVAVERGDQYLACAPSPKTWHLGFRREIESLHGLDPTLSQFASHIIEFPSG